MKALPQIEVNTSTLKIAAPEAKAASGLWAQYSFGS
jgi:hypothetical protein